MIVYYLLLHNAPGIDTFVKMYTNLDREREEIGEDLRL